MGTTIPLHPLTSDELRGLISRVDAADSPTVAVARHTMLRLFEEILTAREDVLRNGPTPKQVGLVAERMREHARAAGYSEDEVNSMMNFGGSSFAQQIASLQVAAGALTPLDAESDLPSAPRSKTSRKAALEFPNAPGVRKDIVALLLNHSPITRDEIGVHLHRSGNTVRPRVLELLQGGWIEVADEDGQTLAGKAAERVRLTDKALNHLASL